MYNKTLCQEVIGDIWLNKKRFLINFSFWFSLFLLKFILNINYWSFHLAFRSSDMRSVFLLRLLTERHKCHVDLKAPFAKSGHRS